MHVMTLVCKEPYSHMTQLHKPNKDYWVFQGDSCDKKAVRQE